jgi:hypothetical protein
MSTLEQAFTIGQKIVYRGGFNSRVAGRVNGVCPNGNLKVTALHFVGENGERVDIPATTTVRDVIISPHNVEGGCKSSTEIENPTKPG